MEHIAIDLGSKESQVCVRDDSGTTATATATNPFDGVVSVEGLGRTQTVRRPTVTESEGPFSTDTSVHVPAVVHVDINANVAVAVAVAAHVYAQVHAHVNDHDFTDTP